jgi:hypothetical protein
MAAAMLVVMGVCLIGSIVWAAATDPSDEDDQSARKAGVAP